MSGLCLGDSFSLALHPVFLFLFFPLSPVPCAYDLSLSYSSILPLRGAYSSDIISYILHHLHLYIHILVPNDLILTPAGRILLCLDHVSCLSSISSNIVYRLSLVYQTYLSNIPGLDLSILIYQIASTLPLPSSGLGSPPRNNLKHLPSPILH